MALYAVPNSDRRWPIVAYYDFLRERDRSAKELSRLVDCKESDPTGRRELELQKRVFALDSTRLSVLKEPCTVIMREFNLKMLYSTEWKSAPFYTKPEGYKMCLSVDANGYGEGFDSYVSVFPRLMWGEFDYNLEWPFQGSITMELFVENSDWPPDYSQTIVLNQRFTPQEYIQRVESEEMSPKGWGCPKFISHQDLYSYNYLKDDCLSFRVRMTNSD